jgi:serine/threonine protein phosphatase PrpC
MSEDALEHENKADNYRNTVMNLTFCGRTHTCGRPNNEEVFDMQQINDHLALFAVADGLGGHPAGEAASRIAITALVDTVRTLTSANRSFSPAQMQEILSLGFLSASLSVGDDGSRNLDHAGMGTTLLAALINDTFDVVVAHVGDSRAYSASDKLNRITNDHSLVQELVERGLITKEAARLHPDKNVVTRIISNIPVNPEFAVLRLEKNTLLLCTDGLTDALSDEEIFTGMINTDVPRVCADLIERCQRVNRDNTTIIVVRAPEGS